ncbi:MAG: oxidoreductase [Egibacteraceae bacterium]
MSMSTQRKNRRATARWTVSDIPDQQGRTFIVTGANSGIGYAAARELAAKRAHVVMACRDLRKAAVAGERIREAHPSASLEVARLDLADLGSVRDFAADFTATHPRLDGLINNAGVMALPRRVTADGFEAQFGTNHLGHFALTGLLLPTLLASGPARIVNVSSTGHRAGHIRFDDLMGERRYRPWPAYFQSKLANLLFTYELQRRLTRQVSPVIAVACHPGLSATQLGQASIMPGWLDALAHRLVAQPALVGALPTLRAATAPGVAGGDYYGPSGFAELHGTPVKVRSSKASHDVDAARRLWDRSVQLTGVDFHALQQVRTPGQ